MKTLSAMFLAALLLVVGGCTMAIDVRFVQTPGVVERTELERTTETRTTETTQAATNPPPVVLQKVDPCVECDRMMKGMVEK